ALPVISHGIPTCEVPLNTGCVSAVRKTWNKQECIILMNIHYEPAEVSLDDYADFTLAASLSTNGEPITLDGSVLTLPLCGTAVLIRK
ncbi:MAG: hypothetical protein MJ074_10545, partial [Oscillospiraceae bacterium]|nr:hypothetical protein [Oscillospiraceae bacterium]